MVFELMNQGGRNALESHGGARPVKGGLHLRAVKAGIDVIHTPFDRISAPGATRITDDEEGPSAIPAQLPLICVDAHPTTGASTRIYQVKQDRYLHFSSLPEGNIVDNAPLHCLL